MSATLDALQAFGLSKGARVTDLPADNQASDLDQAAGAQTRGSRKNLLLSASIESGGLKAPVRIRNLSDSGAMIDGAALPEVGTALVLRRLELEIGAMTVWRAPGRCGIRFEGRAAVADWVAGVRKSPMSTDRSEASADRSQTAIPRGAPLPPAESPGSPSSVHSERLEKRIAEELTYVGRLLDAVGDELTEDPIMLHRHGRALQNFDVARRMLVHIGAIVGAADRDAALDAVTMHELRARLRRR